MAVERVGIEIHLAVEADQLAILGHHQRIDLEHAHVFLDKQPVELADHLHALTDLITGQSERERDVAAVEREITRGRIDGQRDDLLRRVVGHLLDVHAACLRRDERDAAGGAIDQRREIQLAIDLRTVLDVEPLHDAASGTGLHGDQRVTQHLLGELTDLVDRLGEPHATLVAGSGLLELAFAATTGVDLRLDHPDRAGKLLSRLDGIFHRECSDAIRRSYAILTIELFGLIFMDVHGKSCAKSCRCRRTAFSCGARWPRSRDVRQGEVRRLV